MQIRCMEVEKEVVGAARACIPSGLHSLGCSHSNAEERRRGDEMTGQDAALVRALLATDSMEG